MGTAFLTNFAAESGSTPYSAAQSLVSAVLAEPFWTEVSEYSAHSWKLHKALKYAEDCQEALLKEHHTDAVILFVKACASSICCLESLEDFALSLRHALMVVEHKHVNQALGLPLPPVLKAAKLILLGYNMVPPKPKAEYVRESFELLMGESLNTADWQLKQLVLHLTDRDIDWVMCLGHYKLAYRLALLYRSKPIDAEYEQMYTDLARQGAEALIDWEDCHPAALEARVQVLMLQGMNYYDVDPMYMQDGCGYALAHCHDSALAMQHVLQSMYFILQVYNGRPDRAAQHLLQDGADHVMELYDFMLYDRGVWEKVKGRLVAAMLMLGNTWPLAKALNDHALVSFINEQHQILRKQLLQRQLQPENKQPETHKASGSDSASPTRESPREEEEEVAKKELLCARCDKYMGRQMEKVECQGCHVTFYCSNECMKKHAVIHKGACKRAKLRSKLATKPSTK
ncbi:hypothetical protein WJX77_010544 [Trebouxia sp. C0004]